MKYPLLAARESSGWKRSFEFADNIDGQPFHFTKQFIGAIEMERLFTDYKRKNENAVSMREFHAKILNEGSIPISQLRKMILN